MPGPSITGPRSMRFVSRSSSAALAALLLAATLPPSAAQQDSVTQELQDIRNSVGLGPSTPPIDFTERPPLVVPPSYALPPPGRGDTDRLGVKDTDAANRRRALIDPRRPVPPTDPGAAATGLAARTYLVDPPSGLRDPDATAADVTHDSGSTAAPARRARARKKKTAAQ